MVMSALTIATRLSLLWFGQPADAVEAPLLVALFWGFLPAVIAFITGCLAKGFLFARRRILWLALLFALIYFVWLFLCNIMYLPDELGIIITIYGGIAVSWIVAFALLLVPLKPFKDSKENGKNHEANSIDHKDEQPGA